MSLAFPHGRSDWKRAADWNWPDLHRTTACLRPGACDFEWVLDDDGYFARLSWSGEARWGSVGPHEWHLWAAGEALEFTVAFAPNAQADGRAARLWGRASCGGGALGGVLGKRRRDGFVAKRDAPGFPDDENWTVEHEGLQPMA